MCEMMASGDLWSVLGACLEKINANTSQPENFLRQVFAIFMHGNVEKAFKGSHNVVQLYDEVANVCISF